MVKLTSKAKKNTQKKGTVMRQPSSRQGRTDRALRGAAAASTVLSRTMTNGLSESLALPASAVPMYAQCMASPEDCPPCRVPDEYVSPTSALKLVREFTVSSDASGQAVWSINPPLASNVITYSLTAGAVTSAAADQHPDYTNLIASFSQGRIVATEIIVTYIGAPLGASGRLVAIEQGFDGAIANGTVLTSIMDDGDTDAAINGRRIIVRPTQAPRFEAITSNANFMAPTFAAWQFVALGLPNTTVCFSVRTVSHFEGIPLKNSIMRGSAVPEPANPDNLTIAANISQVAKTGPADGKQMMKAAVLKAAGVAWKALGPQVSRAMASGGAAAMASSRAALLALM